jgi:small subunit ribosomal protein S9
MEKTITTQGKRKRAIARATLRPGHGKVVINGTDLEFYEPKLYRLRIMEPILLSGEVGAQTDIEVTITGGGQSSQSDAARLSIGKAFVQISPKLKKLFLEYDRQLLVADVRRKESAKPGRHGHARAKRQKSYR